MYRYDEFDAEFVRQRVAQFRDQVGRRLSGELTEEEFKPLRLMNGVYLQLHAYMLRIAIPYGTLNSRQMRKLAHIARTYDRGTGHFTTRQNLQFNWPKLSDIPDILEELAEVEMHAIQTSGNNVRNVTADHFAGATAEEVADPRPYAEIIRQWSSLHPEFSFLPRKFKIGITASEHDRSAIKTHDIGLKLQRLSNTALGFAVWAGGGQGRTPYLAQKIRDQLPAQDLLSYIEAILRVYNLHGRRDNIHKARIKILLKSLGLERFRAEVEAEWQAGRATAPPLTSAEVERVRGFFRPQPYETLEDLDPTAGRAVSFKAWYRYNTRAHRVPGYRAVFVSLKAHGAVPGDMSSAQMEGVAALAERVSFGLIRSTHTQNLLLADVPQRALYEVWRELAALGLAMPNIGTLTDMIACPGLDFCSLANAGTIAVAQQIQQRFDDLDYLYDLGEIEIKMSGCMNACGHHHVGHIGILGVDKHGEEWYQISLGGSANGSTALGEVIGPSVAQHEVAPTIERIVETYRALREEGERFIDTVRRLGLTPFRERAYAAHPAAA